MSGVTSAAGRENAAPASSEFGLFVYGVMDARDSVPDGLTGLDAEPVTALASGRVAAIVTQVSIERPPGRGAELLAYNAVLDALAQGPTVVAPVRFGSVLGDEQAVVEDFLAPDEDYFAELLASLRGRDQYMFQAVYDEQQILSEVVAAEPEIAELRRYTSGLPQDAAYGERVRLGELVAAAVEGRRSMDAEWLLEQVLPLSEAHSLRAVSGLERVVDAALLVDSDRREDFEARLETLAEEVHGRLRLRLMGPTAPYDFTGGI